MAEKTYRSYVLRCWHLPSGEAGRPPTRRFVVETISGSPRRLGFNTMAELILFLQTELTDSDGAKQAAG